jgi:ABC-type transport system substrate-binding protein
VRAARRVPRAATREGNGLSDRAKRTIITVLVGLAVLTGCTNAPPPPLVTTPVASTVPNRPANPREVVVGVDNVAGGYNPHKLADQSAVTTALANLLLPSVFRQAPDGTPELDTTLMISAEVTKAQPYTVVYQIRREASWADNAPIAAEDFVYLREQLRDAPDAINSAGYRLISNISARDAGKVVEVTFDKPYPGWRSLFSGLVPAHVLKDAPGGWSGALQDNFPTTGGPFAIKTIDRDRGEIVLERNDRYWEQPAALDRIILRRADQRGLVEALRAGHDQLALARLDSSFAALLDQPEPVVTRHTAARSTVVTLLVRPTGDDLRAEGVRRAIVALLDRAQLIATGAGDSAMVKTPADAQVLAPSAPGYTSTLPAGLSPGKPDFDLATLQLSDAGYVKTTGSWARNGRQLSLVVGAPAERPSYVDIAQEVVRELAVQGVQARVVTLPGAELISRIQAQTTANGNGDDLINLAVVPMPTGGDPATTMATNFGCVTRSGNAPPTPLSAIGSCDQAIQPTIDAALTASIPLSDALSTVEPAVWRQAVSIPLYQEAETLAVRPEMSGVDIGSSLSGPFAGAAAWKRTVR